MIYFFKFIIAGRCKSVHLEQTPKGNQYHFKIMINEAINHYESFSLIVPKRQYIFENNYYKLYGIITPDNRLKYKANGIENSPVFETYANFYVSGKVIDVQQKIVGNLISLEYFDNKVLRYVCNFYYDGNQELHIDDEIKIIATLHNDSKNKFKIKEIVSIDSANRLEKETKINNILKKF